MRAGRTRRRRSTALVVTVVALALAGCAKDRPVPSPSITVSGSISGTLTQAACIDTGPGGLEIRLADQAAAMTARITISDSRLTAVRVDTRGGGASIAASRPTAGDMTFGDRTVIVTGLRIDDASSTRAVTLQGQLACRQG